MLSLVIVDLVLSSVGFVVVGALFYVVDVAGAVEVIFVL